MNDQGHKRNTCFGNGLLKKEKKTELGRNRLVLNRAESMEHNGNLTGAIDPFNPVHLVAVRIHIKS